MDGLTIRNAQSFVESGKAVSSTSQPKLQSGDNAGSASFADTLKQAVNQVNDLQKQADTVAQKVATGESQNLHEAMIAMEKADIAMKLMIRVRNKIIDAYQEVMKMQV